MVGDDHYLTNVRNKYKLLTLKSRKLLKPYEDSSRKNPGVQQAFA